MVLICPLEMVSGISHLLVKDRHLSMNLLLKKICVAFIISGLLFLEPAQACSRIAYVSSQGTIIARTMDLYMDDHAKMMIYPGASQRNQILQVVFLGCLIMAAWRFAL